MPVIVDESWILDSSVGLDAEMYASVEKIFKRS